MRYLIAFSMLTGCLSGASGIISSGVDGNRETELPVGKHGCYLTVGDTTNRVHCPNL